MHDPLFSEFLANLLEIDPFWAWIIGSLLTMVLAGNLLLNTSNKACHFLGIALTFIAAKFVIERPFHSTFLLTPLIYLMQYIFCGLLCISGICFSITFLFKK